MNGTHSKTGGKHCRTVMVGHAADEMWSGFFSCLIFGAKRVR